ncbi:UrcA family protein [Brevundimonas bacteroides]|uniref:UrcA family protein n=1 Tax=Brevundimonas bacteroides TaxID=74311 RepID=UPI0004972154|nr:UrcA family protein [Brevundimonas bacteroides]
MSVSLILAAALMTPAAPSAEPELRVAIGDLDFTRPADQDAFVQRVRDASRAFCDRHLEVVTPDRLGDPAICRSEMRRLAYRALPDRQRGEIASTGRYRVIR